MYGIVKKWLDYSATYKLEGNQLIVNAAGDTATAEILKLEEEILDMLIEQDRDADGEEEEVRVSFTRE